MSTRNQETTSNTDVTSTHPGTHRSLLSSLASTYFFRMENLSFLVFSPEASSKARKDWICSLIRRVRCFSTSFNSERVRRARFLRGCPSPSKESSSSSSDCSSSTAAAAAAEASIPSSPQRASSMLRSEGGGGRGEWERGEGRELV